MKNTKPSVWLIAGALFVAALFLAIYLQPDRNLESYTSRESTTQE